MKSPATRAKISIGKPSSGNTDFLGTGQFGSEVAATGRVKFGDVVVMVDKPTDAAIKKSACLSGEALARAKSKIVRGGVRLYPKKDVPLYFADEQTPGVFIRKLNGTIARGRLEDGRFAVLEDDTLQAAD